MPWNQGTMVPTLSHRWPLMTRCTGVLLHVPQQAPSCLAALQAELQMCQVVKLFHERLCRSRQESRGTVLLPGPAIQVATASTGTEGSDTPPISAAA